MYALMARTWASRYSRCASIPSYRTVHLDIVELAVIDQTAKKTRFDFFEELYFLVIVLKTVADDILFQTVERFSQDT